MTRPVSWAKAARRVRAGMFAVFVAALGVAADSGAARAGFIPDGISPNPRDILCDGEKLGTLEITNYYGFTTNGAGVYDPRNPYPGSGFREPNPPSNRGGAYMEAIFRAAANSCPMNYQWIQAITGGKGTIGTPPYLDPFNRDDNLPFFWRRPEANSPTLGKANGLPGSRFADIASQQRIDATKGNSVQFETALVCYNGMTVHWLAGFTWGYEIKNDLSVAIDAFAWTADMSNTMKGLVEGWASTPKTPYLPKPGQKPDGWKVSDDCCTCVPEPSTLLGAGVGLAVLLLVPRSRRLSTTGRAA